MYSYYLLRYDEEGHFLELVDYETEEHIAYLTDKQANELVSIMQPWLMSKYESK